MTPEVLAGAEEILPGAEEVLALTREVLAGTEEVQTRAREVLAGHGRYWRDTRGPGGTREVLAGHERYHRGPGRYLQTRRGTLSLQRRTVRARKLDTRVAPSLSYGKRRASSCSSGKLLPGGLSVFRVPCSSVSGIMVNEYVADAIIACGTPGVQQRRDR